MELITFLVYVVIFVVILDYMWKPRDNKIPFRIPVLGHVKLLTNSNMHHTLSDWAHQYGDIYTIQMLNTQYMVLNDYESIYEALVTKGAELAGRPTAFRFKLARLDKGIIGRDWSPRFKKIRGLMQLHLKQYGEGLKVIQDIVLDISEDLVQSIKENRSQHNTLNPRNDIYLAILNVLSSLLTGTKHELSDPLFQKWLKMMYIADNYAFSIRRGMELDIFPWLRYFGNESYKQIQEYNKLNQEMYSMFVKMKNEKTNEKGVATALINAMEEDSVSRFSNEDISAVITDIMVAGILTTSTAFTAFLQIMAAHPDIQRKVYEEILDISENKKHGKITLTDREQMPYTRACLLELQRYTTVGSLAAPHQALCDTSVKGIPIPKGTQLFVNLWNLHHDPRYWKDPWSYNPERYLTEDGELVPSDHINRRMMLAFGAGPRVCPGQNLAMARLFIFVTSLLKEFEICPVKDGPVDPQLYDPRFYEFQATLNINECELKFVDRSV